MLLWQATQGVLDALLVTGLLLLPISLIALGVAMLRSPAFGKGYGWLSTTLGMAGLVAALALVVEVSDIAVVVIFASTVFHITVGWKTYRLSAPKGATAELATGMAALR